MRHFLATRILWTAYTHDLPTRLPTNAQLVSLQGLCELEYYGKKEGVVKPKKSFLLRTMAPLGPMVPCRTRSTAFSMRSATTRC